MKTLGLSLLIAFFSAGLVWTGEIYGTLYISANKSNPNPAGPGVQVRYVLGNRTLADDTTDEYGRFRMFVREEVVGALEVVYLRDGSSARLEKVPSYSRPTQYDLLLELTREGQTVSGVLHLWQPRRLLLKLRW